MFGHTIILVKHNFMYVYAAVSFANGGRMREILQLSERFVTWRSSSPSSRISRLNGSERRSLAFPVVLQRTINVPGTGGNC